MRGRGGGGGRGLRRRARPGVVGVGAALAVAGLWWWSLGAADPVAPGAGTSAADATDGVSAGAGATGLEAALLPGGAGRAPSDGGGPGGATPEALARVRSAAQRAADAPTSRFTLTVALADDAAAAPLTVASGVVDAVSGGVAMSLEQRDPSSASSATSLEAIAVGEVLYVRSPSLNPPDEPSAWWRIAVGTDSGPAAGSGSSPASVSGLVALVATGTAAEVVGPATEGGEAVTRLRVELPGTATTAGLTGTEPGWAVVGIADDGSLRSVEVRGSGVWGAAAGRAVVVRLALDGLGDPVDIRVPDPADVREPAGNPAAGGR